MVAFSTIFLLVKIIQQPIRIFDISGYWSCHGEQNAGYHVKEHKKLGQILVSKVNPGGLDSVRDHQGSTLKSKGTV